MDGYSFASMLKVINKYQLLQMTKMWTGWVIPEL